MTARVSDIRERVDAIPFDEIRSLSTEAGERILRATDEQLLSLRLEVDAAERILRDPKTSNQVVLSLHGELERVGAVLDFEIKRRRGEF